MKTSRGELSSSQIDAGLAVMRGEFKGAMVMSALSAAGVTDFVSAAERLISRELKSGNIERNTRGIYRAA